MDREKIRALETVEGMEFPFHPSGLDYMEELGLTPRTSMMLIEVELRRMNEELDCIGKSLKVLPKISEGEAFIAIAEAFQKHWKTCDGELDKAITLACENLLEAV